jgi:hypothetical protein
MKVLPQLLVNINVKALAIIAPSDAALLSNPAYLVPPYFHHILRWLYR